MPERRDVKVSVTATDRMGAQFVTAEIYTPDSRLKKALRVPPPAVLRTNGIEVPFFRGELRYPDGTRAHIISWDHIIHGGGPVWERKLMRAFDITSVGTNGQNGNGRR